MHTLRTLAMLSDKNDSLVIPDQDLCQTPANPHN
jgi:hypothetical protein